MTFRPGSLDEVFFNIYMLGRLSWLKAICTLFKIMPIKTKIIFWMNIEVL